MIREPLKINNCAGDERFIVAGYVKNEDRTYTVSFTDGISAVFSAEEFFKYDLFADGEENRRTYGELIFGVNFGRARAVALKFAKASPKTAEAVRQRLISCGFSGDTVEPVLDALKEEKELDDRVFAERYVREKTEKGDVSSKMLVLELEARGIDKELAEETVKEAGCDDEAAARKIVEKKVKNGDGRDKVARFLLSKGFRTGLVLDIIGEYFGGD